MRDIWRQHQRLQLVVLPWPLLLLLALEEGVRASGWVQVTRSCPVGCTERGNCNAELGVCECPYGWGGPACEVPVLGACRTSLSEPYVLHGIAMVKSCECLRQVSAAFTINLDEFPKTKVDHPILGSWNEHVCYERLDLPASQQYSDIPEPDEPQTWYQAKVFSDPEGDQRLLVKLAVRPNLTSNHIGGVASGNQYAPLKRCTQSCNYRGACISRKDSATECQCLRGYEGPACEVDNLRMVSTIRCNKQGRLRASWCHCNASWWGQDCTRHTAWAPDPANKLQAADMAYNRTAVRIYRYELPWNVSMRISSFDHHLFSPGGLYEAEDIFQSHLLRDPQVYTENPWEANLFLINAFNILYTGSINTNERHLLLITQWIRKHFPTLLERNQGKDHFVFYVNDHGACGQEHGIARNVMKMSSWGPLENKEIRKGVREGVYVRDYDRWCFTAQRDVVLPVPKQMPDAMLRKRIKEGYGEHLLMMAGRTLHGGGGGAALDGPHITMQAPAAPPRKYLVFFGGDYRLYDKIYSGGARQMFHDSWVKNNSTPDDFKVGGDMWDHAIESEFCLVMAGTGFPSTRLTMAMLSGCIPVIFMDFILQPFHDLLPWGRMALRLRHQDMPLLRDILRSLSEAERAHYRHAMARYVHAFHWGATEHGAYNLTIRTLHHRLFALWGLQYRKRDRR